MRPSSRSAIAGLERDQRALAVFELDLEQVAGAEILDRDDGADARSRRGRRTAGRSGRRDNIRLPRAAAAPTRSTSTSEPRSASAALRSAIALEPRDGRLAAVADGEQAPLDVRRRTASCARQAVDAVAEQLEAHLALDAMRPGDRGERDSFARQRSLEGGTICSAFSPVSRLCGESPRPALRLGRRLFGRSFVGRRFLGGALPRPELRRHRARRRPSPRRRCGFGRSCLVAELSRFGLSAAASSADGFLGRRLPRLSRRLSARQLPRRRLCLGRSASAVASSACFGDDGLGLVGLRLGAALRRLAASAASAAFVARSSTRSLAFSPGSAFFGLLRAGALADAGGVEEAQRRGPTAGRRRYSQCGCGRRRASPARANPWPAADCRCRASR